MAIVDFEITGIDAFPHPGNTNLDVLGCSLGFSLKSHVLEDMKYSLIVLMDNELDWFPGNVFEDALGR